MGSWFDFASPDGTRLRGWCNDGAGPPVVISNGLGCPPEAWPSLLAVDCGYRVLTWAQRGTFGSERPADPRRIGVPDHAGDLLALMDAVGLERALVAGWSIGVNVAFVAARAQPHRVAGVLAVAGVPGGTFRTMGAPLGVPERWRQPLAVALTRGLRLIGPLLTVLAARLPIGRKAAWLLSHSGVMGPAAHQEDVLPFLRAFVPQDWRWYGALALAASQHQPMEMTSVPCPTTWLAGQDDVLTSMHDILAVAHRLPDAVVEVLSGKHFLPLEHPERVNAALGALLTRADLV